MQLEILRNNLHNMEREGQGVRVISVLDDGEKIELMTRYLVRGRFIAALKGKLKMPLLKELKEVFFGLVYPTPPAGWCHG